ncbi:hypothetical protein GH714_034907 [Hevea brasiliensis]|uniref:Uncharacterized protein n=1 Tax=Hevea brasiliensis TaxID=3981 RepID=A0A6A6N9L9_HEVBR|nr:hypothetical protein GH714_034907 [Hevea brasiliensis]
MGHFLGREFEAIRLLSTFTKEEKWTELEIMQQEEEMVTPGERPIVEVIRHKAQSAVPEPGSVVIARFAKVMAKMASADIMCVGPKTVQEKFTGIMRYVT